MIHNTSIIDKKAKISKSANIGPFCFVGPNVELKENVNLISNVHIEGYTTVGKGTKIFPFASIGTQPQDLKFNNEKNSLVIGENNTIREYVTINPGTEGGGLKTIIGNNCLFMISSHIAHDCKIGNNVIIANNVPLGGHVLVEDSVIIGLCLGHRNYLEGLNLIGLRRQKYDNSKIMELNKAYKEIFSSSNLLQNLNKIREKYKNNILVSEIINFINKDKKRPICLPNN